MVAVILALFIRTFVVQAFKIPTGSMETNLLIGDHLLVNKLVYSPSLGAGRGQALLAKKPIRRGHVIVFKYPEDPTRDFIKRVIGLPGETVEIRDKASTSTASRSTSPTCISSSPRSSPQDPEYGYRSDGSATTGGRRWCPRASSSCMGDNRDNSTDSRFWGFLPIDQVKGRALLVYWSYEASREEYHRTGWLDWLRDTVGGVRQDALEPVLPPDPLRQEERCRMSTLNGRGQARLDLSCWPVRRRGLAVWNVIPVYYRELQLQRQDDRDGRARRGYNNTDEEILRLLEKEARSPEARGLHQRRARARSRRWTSAARSTATTTARRR